MSGGAGYSGKPLFQKLGIKEGMEIGVAAAPPHHNELMAGAPPGFWHFGKTPDILPGELDMVQLFCATEKDLLATHEVGLEKVGRDGMLWVCWPKKTSPLFQDLTEGMVRSVILPENLWVDVKVCALDGDWSGLKFLRRKTPAESVSFGS